MSAPKGNTRIMLPVHPPDEQRKPGSHRRHRIREFVHRWTMRVAIGIALLLSVAAFAVVVAQREDAREETEIVERQRDEVAGDLQEDAVTIAALCATGGDVARALEAAGQCGKAAQRLSDPVVAAAPPRLTPEQINAIVARVLELAPAPLSLDAVVNAVLARIASDPTLRGLSEAQVRNIVNAAVAAAIAELPTPSDGADGTDGTSFGGIAFGRNADGQCVAFVTFVEPDGSTRTEQRPVGEQVCAPAPPPPTTTPPPPPPTTTTTEPPPTTTAPPTSEEGLLGG